MSRIDDLMSKKGNGAKADVQCGGPFPPTEADRLNAAWRHSGAKTRGDFVYNAVMDAVEKVEKAKGGVDALAKLEAARVQLAMEAKKKAAAAAAPAPAKK